MARLSSIPSSNSHVPSTNPISTIRVPPKQTATETRSQVAPDKGVASLPIDRSLYPDGYRSLSFISVQAFVLGNGLSACLLLTAWLVQHEQGIWRLPAFFFFLSLFHFLEFYTTARFNTPAARASSFLLFNNGSAYTSAHALATVEIILSNYMFPSYQSFLYSWASVLLGLGLIVVGQSFRSVAMAQAGTNFNHIIAQERKDSHVLITHGVYSIVRHPSYFGFFWWAIGTQILIGNKICLLGYGIVLWRFFRTRIRAEERYLMQFFEKYADFKKQTPTAIPFIT